MFKNKFANFWQNTKFKRQFWQIKINLQLSLLKVWNTENDIGILGQNKY